MNVDGFFLDLYAVSRGLVLFAAWTYCAAFAFELIREGRL